MQTRLNIVFLLLELQHSTTPLHSTPLHFTPLHSTSLHFNFHSPSPTPILRPPLPLTSLCIYASSTPLATLNTYTMPTATPKRVLKDETAKHNNVMANKKRKIDNNTRGQRLAKLSQDVPKSSFEDDLGRLTQEMNTLKGGLFGPVHFSNSYTNYSIEELYEISQVMPLTRVLLQETRKPIKSGCDLCSTPRGTLTPTTWSSSRLMLKMDILTGRLPCDCSVLQRYSYP